uniref:NADAR domain-containing protein n=1 Tax=Parascaris univalens TaxID=6257 RepID=A0A915B721_PARUN
MSMTVIVRLEDGRRCTLFHSTLSPFSNYYRCKFRVDDADSATSNYFISSKQYIMYRKALLFGDIEIAKAIMMEREPRKVKALSLSLRKYNGTKWNAMNDEEMRRGLVAKFAQNDHLRRMLLLTGDSLIAECSGKERIWGNGLKFNDVRARDQKKWKGRNKLGLLLMDVREMLRQNPLFEDEVKEIDAKLKESENCANEYYAEIDAIDSLNVFE